MTTINIDGVGRVHVSDNFLSLSHDDQNKTVEEIAGQLRAGKVATDISSMSALDVAKTAVSNIPSSAAQYGKDLIAPIAHPIETATNLGNLGKGVLQKLGIVSGDDATKYADAAGQFLKDRYGSLAGIKKTLATDPVGLAADLSLVLSLGRAAPASGPTIVTKVAKAAADVGHVIDPLTAVGKAAGVGGKVAAQFLGVTTGAGADAIKLATEAGAKGGSAARAFRESIAGEKPVEEIVDEARSAMAHLREARGDEYTKGMTKVKADKTVLNFNLIDAAINKVASVKVFKGQNINPATARNRAAIIEAVNEWKSLDPKEFHTPEGLDALKQKVGDIRDATQYGTPERLVNDAVYRAIRKSIVDQVPEYGKVMKGYEEASTILKEIEKALSLGHTASVDSSLRKLQSVLRDNVSTNYGNRRNLVEFLAKAGAPDLLYKIAGQALKSPAPRGIMRAVVGGHGLAAIASFLAGNPALAVGLTGSLAAASPLLAGSAAYGVGVTRRLPLRTIGRSAFQAGRLGNNSN
jgi:hypothetical protein